MAALSQASVTIPRNVIVGSSPMTAKQAGQELPHAELSQFSSERLLRIARSLQTSLDVAEIIEMFAQEVKLNVPIDGVRYFNSQHTVDLKVGRNGAHLSAFCLSLNEQSLGEITFTRKTSFTSAQSNELELLLPSVVHPLRNALLYQAALLKAQRDPLTGAYNRAALTETLARDVELAQRHHNPLSIIVLDIDHFKTINDTYGHAAGDCLLKALTNRANTSIRRCDILFRYGGEEFVVVLNNTDEKGALRLAERIRRNIEKENFLCAGQAIRMSVSAGIAPLRDKDAAAQLFERADQALYRAKSEGRNCVRVAVVD